MCGGISPSTPRFFPLVVDCLLSGFLAVVECDMLKARTRGKSGPRAPAASKNMLRTIKNKLVSGVAFLLHERSKSHAHADTFTHATHGEGGTVEK